MMDAYGLLPYLFAALVGVCIGSFLNVVIVRVPDPQRRFFEPLRSACLGCGSDLRARDNVPLLSYFRLRGRARCCGAPISAMYPAVEGLGAVVSLVALWRFGWEIQTAVIVASLWIALVIAACDWRERLIPWRFPLLGLLLVLGWSVVGRSPEVALGALLDGVLLAGSLALLASVVGWVIGRPFGGEDPVMGEADVVVAAFLGAWVGIGPALVAMVYAAVAGLAVAGVGAVPVRLRRVAAVVYGGVFVSGVFLGGGLFVASLVVLLVAAWPAYRQEAEVEEVPFATWMMVGGALALLAPLPAPGAIESLHRCLPWHLSGAAFLPF